MEKFMVNTSWGFKVSAFDVAELLMIAIMGLLIIVGDGTGLTMIFLEERLVKKILCKSIVKLIEGLV